MASRTSRIFAALGLSMVLSLSLAAEADAARRGGSFGSRGARTYQAPPPTKTAPGQTNIMAALYKGLIWAGGIATIVAYPITAWMFASVQPLVEYARL